MATSCQIYSITVDSEAELSVEIERGASATETESHYSNTPEQARVTYCELGWKNFYIDHQFSARSVLETWCIISADYGCDKVLTMGLFGKQLEKFQGLLVNDVEMAKAILQHSWDGSGWCAVNGV